MDVVNDRFDDLSILHLACKYGRYSIVSYLLQSRRSYDISDKVKIVIFGVKMERATFLSIMRVKETL